MPWNYPKLVWFFLRFFWVSLGWFGRVPSLAAWLFRRYLSEAIAGTCCPVCRNILTLRLVKTQTICVSCRGISRGDCSGCSCQVAFPLAFVVSSHAWVWSLLSLRFKGSSLQVSSCFPPSSRLLSGAFPSHIPDCRLYPVRPPGWVWILPPVLQPGSDLLTVSSSTCKARFHFSLLSKISVLHSCRSVSESCCLIIYVVLQFFKAREIVFQSLLN